MNRGPGGVRGPAAALRHGASGGWSQLQCRRLQMPVHVSHLRPLERPRHQAPQLPQTGCAPGLLHSDSSPESSEVAELPAPLTKSLDDQEYQESQESQEYQEYQEHQD
ncbi:MAG: hypothetical protein ABGY24_10385, partial [bacterium]